MNGYIAFFIPARYNFLGEYELELDRALWFNDESELCAYIRRLVETTGTEIGWGLETIEDNINYLMQGYEVGCLGRVCYPTFYNTNS
jgi:hypothetical protein